MLVSALRLKSFEVSCLCLFLFSCILTFTSAPLSASYWLDECISAWVSSGTTSQVVDRTLKFQGQSPLYFLLLWLWRTVFFDTEICARALSLFLFCLAAISLYRLATRLFNSQVGFLSLIPFLLHDQVLISAIQARPYMLALLCYITSLDFLLTYLHTNRWLHGVLSLLFLILAFYAHYLFILGILVHVLALFCFSQSSRHRSALLITSFFVGAFFCFPAIPHLKSLAARSADLSFSVLPGIGDLLLAFVPVSMLVYIVCGMVLPWSFLKCEFMVQEREWRKYIFVLLWIILAPLLYFLHAWISGHSLFQERYFLWTAPAVALACGYLMSLYHGRRARLICLCVFVTFGLSREISREWKLEDWRSAVAEMNDAGDTSQLWLYSGLIEVENSETLLSPENEDYLRAPLLVYGYRGESRLLSTRLEELSSMRNSNVIRLLLANKVLINREGQGGSLVELLIQKIRALGFGQIERRNFGELIFITAFREKSHAAIVTTHQ